MEVIELWDGIEFLECPGEGVGKTPDRPRTEFVVLRFKVEIVHCAGQMLRRFELAFDERLVDHKFCGDISEFTSLPSLNLLTHGLEVPFRSVGADRMQSINENDFECLASTGVKSPLNAMFE
jgi:hypothetical protein